MSLLNVNFYDACPSKCSVSMSMIMLLPISMQQGRGHAAWKWTCSSTIMDIGSSLIMDMDTEHLLGHASQKLTFSKDMGMLCSLEGDVNK
jgi:hypothetical protein